MRAADRSNYELLDAFGEERSERWDEVILIRPDPQIIWRAPHEHPMWKYAHACYLRSNTDGGRWEKYCTVSSMRKIKYRKLTFQFKVVGSKHIGIFPKQAVNWDFVGKKIREADRPVRVLNLLDYTDAVMLACAPVDAEVCYMDASKGMVAWARENVAVSGLSDRPVCWLVGDRVRSMQCEQRQGNTYDGIIMNLPPHGRGPGSEVWKLEEQLYPLVQPCVPLLSKDTLFLVSNSYTIGLSPSVTAYLLGTLLRTRFDGSILADKIGLPVIQSGLVLPRGNTAIWAG